MGAQTLWKRKEKVAPNREAKRKRGKDRRKRYDHLREREINPNHGVLNLPKTVSSVPVHNEAIALSIRNRCTAVIRNTARANGKAKRDICECIPGIKDEVRPKKKSESARDREHVRASK